MPTVWLYVAGCRKRATEAPEFIRGERHTSARYRVCIGENPFLPYGKKGLTWASEQTYPQTAWTFTQFSGIDPSKISSVCQSAWAAAQSRTIV